MRGHGVGGFLGQFRLPTAVVRCDSRRALKRFHGEEYTVCDGGEIRKDKFRADSDTTEGRCIILVNLVGLICLRRFKR